MLTTDLDSAKGAMMHELVLMDPSKETQKKLRWQADVDGVNFYLYIPQWRVPYPWPRLIRARIYSDKQEILRKRTPRAQPGDDDKLLQNSVSAVLLRVSDHSETVRYSPIERDGKLEIGDPYIPYGLLEPDIPDVLRIEVRWDWSQGTWTDS